MTMSDLIDREQVIDALDKLCDRVCRYSKEQRAVMCGACPLGSAFDVIEEFPSAEKTGKWIITDAYPHKVYCSECYATLIPNVEWFKTYNIASNYCPNCGARMVE